MYYRVLEAMQIHTHGMPSKNSTNKKIKKESEFKSRFRDGGYIIPVEKPNKQGS